MLWEVGLVGDESGRGKWKAKVERRRGKRKKGEIGRRRENMQTTYKRFTRLRRFSKKPCGVVRLMDGLCGPAWRAYDCVVEVCGCGNE